jgi:hypothetical protein
VRGVFLSILCLASPVAAAGARDLAARLHVEKAAGAEQCPEQQQLERRVEGILQRPLSDVVADSQLTLEVRFERTPNAFTAQVTATGPKPGRRLLRDTGPTCDALGEAVSVAIALLLDSSRPDHDAPSPSRESLAPVDEPAAPAPAQPSNDMPAGTTGGFDARRWTARAAVEVGGGYGLGGSGALFGFARLGARHGGWLLDIGVGGNLPSEQSFDTGSVRTSLVFGSLRACYLIGRSLLVAPCAQLGLGRLHGEGYGYGQARAASLPWTAAGLGLAAEAPVAGALYLTLAATLWVPTRRQTFSVENAGIAWESKPVAGVLTAGLGLSLF